MSLVQDSERAPRHPKWLLLPQPPSLRRGQKVPQEAQLWGLVDPGWSLHLTL